MLFRYKKCKLCDKMIKINTKSLSELNINMIAFYHMECIDKNIITITKKEFSKQTRFQYPFFCLE